MVTFLACHLFSKLSPHTYQNTQSRRCFGAPTQLEFYKSFHANVNVHILMV
jgi:hypothetical protein